MLRGRGINGIISAELIGYFSGSLGMNVTVSTDETFTGDANSIMTALMQESGDNDEHLIADSNDLLVNAASLNVAGNKAEQGEKNKMLLQKNVNRMILRKSHL